LASHTASGSGASARAVVSWLGHQGAVWRLAGQGAAASSGGVGIGRWWRCLSSIHLSVWVVSIQSIQVMGAWGEN
jgi:hypothetical protein